MYNSNTDSLGLILGVEVFFSLGHCSGALCAGFEECHNTAFTAGPIRSLIPVAEKCG